MSDSSVSVSAEVREGAPLAQADLLTVDGTAYHRLRWFALALVCAASFMEILDAQIVTVAIPSIERSLGLSAGHVQWLLSGYAVAFGGLLLVGGRAGDLFGRRRMFIISVAGFTLFSLLSALAWTGSVLIAARVGQGVSAAGMAPAEMAILVNAFSDDVERGKAFAIAGAVTAAGGSAGALIGGPFVQWLGWRSIFFLNVPIGAAIFAMSPVVLAGVRERLESKINLTGAMTGAGALLLLVYAVNQAPGASWLRPAVLWPLCGFVILGALFVVNQKLSAEPLVPVRIFRSRALIGGNLVMFAAAVCVFGQGIVLTQYAQQIIGYDPLEFGLMTAVVPTMAVIGSIASQRAVSKVGLRPVAAISLTLIALGCGLLTQLSPHGDFVRDMLPGMLILGPGLGAGTVAASIAAITGIDPNDAGVASGISNISFAIGGALGVAGLTSIGLAWAGHVLGRPGMSAAVARTEGFQWAMAVAAAVALLGVIAALTLLGKRSPEEQQ
jgi:EmrB/QacA subfamily drug resistance transporter